MYIKSVTLRDFRSHELTELTLSPGINLLCGENGAGKTNLLEAVFLFASGKSFRGQTDRELISFGKPGSYLKLVFADRFSEHTLEMNLYKNRRRLLFKDGCEVKKLSEYLGLFRAVVFTPDHLRIIKSSPEHRRRLADIAICQAFPRYVASLSEFNRILLQKNNLLKSGVTELSLPMLEVYNERLAQLSALITLNRYNYVNRLSEKAAVFMEEMTNGKEKLRLVYETQYGGSFDREELYNNCLAQYKKKQEAELAKKVTLIGCHHDDFAVMINGKDARSFASQGQQRSAVLSLKLAEGELARQYTGEDSVFLFDDVLSELDKDRRAYVTGKLEGRQFILTGCDIPEDEDVNVFCVARSAQKTDTEE